MHREVGVPATVTAQPSTRAVVLEAVGLDSQAQLLAAEVDDGEEPRVGDLELGVSSNPSSIVRARNTDSNGFAARPSARSAMRRAAREPGPRSVDAAATSSVRVTSWDRRAESAMARASSNGRTRAQSSTVRSGVVTPWCASPGARSTQRGSTSARCSGRRCRLCLTVTHALCGTAFTAHPWCCAALTCDRVAERDCAVWNCSDAVGRTYRP